jgi:hypothetical protein
MGPALTCARSAERFGSSGPDRVVCQDILRPAVTPVLDPLCGRAVARIGTLIALVCDFGVKSKHPITGTVYAVDLETNSVVLRIADILVSGSVCFAPSFEYDRCIEMHGLRGRAFILSEGDFHSAEQEVRSGIYFSVSTHFR